MSSLFQASRVGWFLSSHRSFTHEFGHFISEECSCWGSLSSQIKRKWLFNDAFTETASSCLRSLYFLPLNRYISLASFKSSKYKLTLYRLCFLFEAWFSKVMDIKYRIYKPWKRHLCCATTLLGQAALHESPAAQKGETLQSISCNPHEKDTKKVTAGLFFLKWLMPGSVSRLSWEGGPEVPFHTLVLKFLLPLKERQGGEFLPNPEHDCAGWWCSALL